MKVPSEEHPQVPLGQHRCSRAALFQFSRILIRAHTDESILTPTSVRISLCSKAPLIPCEDVCVCVWMRVIEKVCVNVWLCVSSPSLSVPAHIDLRSQHWQHALLYFLFLSFYLFVNPPLTSSLPSLYPSLSVTQIPPSFPITQNPSFSLCPHTHPSHSSIPSPSSALSLSDSLSLSVAAVVVGRVKKLNLPHAALKRQIVRKRELDSGVDFPQHSVVVYTFHHRHKHSHINAT